MSRFSGWQRLWVLAAVILFGAATFLVFEGYQSSKRVQDIETLAELNKQKVISVRVPSLGTVKFPDDMSLDQIKELIEENYDRNREEIPRLAEAKMHERNARKALEAKRANDAARKSNYTFISLVYIGWLAFIVLLYIGGWSVGWIYRGFKENTDKK